MRCYRRIRKLCQFVLVCLPFWLLLGFTILSLFPTRYDTRRPNVNFVNSKPFTYIHTRRTGNHTVSLEADGIIKPERFPKENVKTERKECELVRPSGPIPAEKFQDIADRRTYVFSAYMDNRNGDSLVRIIGITTKDETVTGIFCRFWYKDRPNSQLSSLQRQLLPESHGTRYVPTLLTCANPARDVSPNVVELVIHHCGRSLATLPVMHRERNPTPLFTVCVSAIHLAYNDVNRFVEMVEVNRFFGAERFIFYNMSIGSDVEEYIRYYVDKGVAEVVQWSLPVTKGGAAMDVYYNGQLAVELDCLYRSLYTTQYLTFLDLDEIIVPYVGDNWKMIVLQRFGREPCIHNFQNVFFRIDWPSNHLFDNNEVVQKYNILSLLKTNRETKLWPRDQRSKYIANVVKLEQPGIHRSWRCSRDSYINYVPPSDGLLHHYRIWDDHRVTKNQTDTVMVKHAKQIIHAIQVLHGNLQAWKQAAQNADQTL